MHVLDYLSGQRTVNAGSPVSLTSSCRSRCGQAFRGKFLAGVKDAYYAGLLTFGDSAAALADPKAFRRLLNACYSRNWVVYAKPPFGGPEQVFRYLGRYSHRVAVSNNRFCGLDDTHVAFEWKDYADGHRVKVMRLAIDEFIRRFLLHVLPKGCRGL